MNRRSASGERQMFPEQTKTALIIASCGLKDEGPETRLAERDKGAESMKHELQYDKAKARLVWNTDAGVGEPLDNDRAKELSAALRAGSWKGEALKEVRVCFKDESAAAYHADALAFLQLAAFAGDRRVESGARFSARADFGIDD